MDIYIDLNGTLGPNSRLQSVSLPADCPQYAKFEKDAFCNSDVTDKTFDFFKYYLEDYRYRSDEFIAWYKLNKEKPWFDVRIGEDKSFYAVTGDAEGIKFVTKIDFITITYRGYELDFCDLEKDNYNFHFWIDPDGGILRDYNHNVPDATDELEYADARYSMKEYTFRSALDDLIAHSDEYQNDGWFDED